MNFKQLKNQLATGDIAKCYYLVGNDNYIISNSIASIEKVLDIQYEELNYSKFGDNFTLDALIAALSSLPFLSKYRLAVLKEFYPNSTDCKTLAECFLKTNNDTSILVIANNKPHEPLKKYLQYMAVVDCNHPELYDCALWIQKRFKNAKISIEQPDAELITEYCLRDMALIAMQCEKLISYIEAGERVTTELIDVSVVKHNEYKIYEFTDALAQKNKNKAYTIMENMLSGGNTETALLAAIYKNFRNMLYVSTTSAAPRELAAALEIPEFTIKRVFEQAKKFSPKSLKNAVQLLSETEYKLKSGKLLGGTFFKYLVLKLVNI